MIIRLDLGGRSALVARLGNYGLRNSTLTAPVEYANCKPNSAHDVVRLATQFCFQIFMKV